jgi:hypothetical protein
MPLREVSVACGFAIAATALHSQYEWVTVTATPQYLVALMAGVIAAVAALSARARPAGAAPSAADPGPEATLKPSLRRSAKTIRR